MGKDGKLEFIIQPKESREACYIPVASFITAYGRKLIVESALKIREYSMKKYGYDAWVYSDTDSLKVLLTDEDLKEISEQGILKIDDYELGYFACENHFDRILCIRQKCYVTEKDGKCSPTVAGLPKYLAPLINFDNFKRGFTTKGMLLPDLVELAKKNGASEEEIEKIHHKLTYKYVKGGVILADTDFTIK